MWKTPAAGWPGGSESNIKEEHELSEETGECLLCLVSSCDVSTARLCLVAIYIIIDFAL